jgi:hypothetical protein
MRREECWLVKVGVRATERIALSRETVHLRRRIDADLRRAGGKGFPDMRRILVRRQ